MANQVKAVGLILQQKPENVSVVFPCWPARRLFTIQTVMHLNSHLFIFVWGPKTKKTYVNNTRLRPRSEQNFIFGLLGLFLWKAVCVIFSINLAIVDFTNEPV